MKKAIFAALAAAAVCFAAFFLPACTEGAGGGNGDGTIPGEGEQTDTSVDFAAYAAFTASDDVLQLTDKTSVKDYIDALADDGKIDVEGYESTYGYYITSVNGVSESTDESGTSGYSWMLYTDFTEEDGVIYADPAYGTFEHGGKTLASASYGVSQLPCVEGYTYALVYQAWSYSA